MIWLIIAIVLFNVWVGGSLALYWRYGIGRHTNVSYDENENNIVRLPFILVVLIVLLTTGLCLMLIASPVLFIYWLLRGKTLFSGMEST